MSEEKATTPEVSKDPEELSKEEKLEAARKKVCLTFSMYAPCI